MSTLRFVDAGSNESSRRIDTIDPATGLRISLVRVAGVAWEQLHSDMTADGIHLPVESHAGFPIAALEHRVLLGVSEHDGHFRWGGVADVGRSRIIPWRSVVRVHRVGRSVPSHALATVVGSLALVGQIENALRIHVELSEPDSHARTRIIEGLSARGYRAVSTARQYERTILIDLLRSEAELLASFHATCRRHIRAFVKYRLRCEPITDQRFAGRLRALDMETMLRTKGSLDPLRWPEMLRFVSEHPSRATVLGVMRTDVSESEALVGYVLGVRHGETVEYRRAASARLLDLRAPLLYMPTWQLMCWAKEVGARVFDFGGVSAGTHASGEATGGIADFKRYFSNQTTEIGSELVHSDVAHLDTLARAVASGFLVVSAALRRRSRV